MTAFIGLMKKEWIIKRSWLLYGVITIFVVFIASSMFATFMGNGNIAVIPLVTVLTLQIFYVPLFLLVSLNLEGKSNLWLHTPQSTFQLLSSKLITAFYMHAILAMILGGILFFVLSAFHKSVGYSPTSNLFLLDITLFVIVVTFLSFYFGIYVIFYWTLNASLKRMKKLEKFRVPLMVVIIIGVNLMMSALKNLPLYNKIMNIGVIRSTPDGMANFPFDGGNSSVYLGGESITLGGIFITITFIIIVLKISSLLLEKVVEA